MENQENMLKNQEKLAFFKKKKITITNHTQICQITHPPSHFLLSTHPDLNLMFKASIFCVHPNPDREIRKQLKNRKTSENKTLKPSFK
jgi:hypothetical protein